jgi:hypothetical protein
MFLPNTGGAPRRCIPQPPPDLSFYVAGRRDDADVPQTVRRGSCLHRCNSLAPAPTSQLRGDGYRPDAPSLVRGCVYGVDYQCL